MFPVRFNTSFLITALALLTVADGVRAQTPTTRPALRVGTYDSRAVAVAYVASQAQYRATAGLKESLKQAEARGDTKAAAQIKQRGKQQQVLRHMQGFSVAPVDDLLVDARDALSKIAKEANVSVIVRNMDYAGPEVVKVDVTDAMVKLFDPSEKTLKTVAELRKQKPITLIEALAIEE